MNSFEAQHPRSASGRWTNKDTRRADSGQVLVDDDQTQPHPVPHPTSRQFHTARTTSFVVLREVENDIAEALMARRNASKTAHAEFHRNHRMRFANPGRVHSSFVVSRNGNEPELHVITDNAEVYVYSIRTAKLITMLYARPGQVRRYFADPSAVPEHIHEAAMLNLQQGNHRR